MQSTFHVVVPPDMGESGKALVDGADLVFFNQLPLYKDRSESKRSAGTVSFIFLQRARECLE